MSAPPVEPSPVSPVPVNAHPAPVAATRHTLIILGVLTLFSVLSARSSGGAPIPAAGGNHLVQYASLLAGEWLLFYGICRGLKSYGTPLSSVFGQGFGTRRGLVIAIVGGAAAWPLIRLVAFGVHFALAHFGAPVTADAARVQAAMEPHGLAESALWVALSISAGICEEFAYRGYLMRQFSAWFGGRVPGLFASALAFGLGHAYQGPWQVLLITLAFGLPMGALALLARGLGPSIVAHALEDVVAGLFG